MKKAYSMDAYFPSVLAGDGAKVVAGEIPSA